jgi:hypothetical protein
MPLATKNNSLIVKDGKLAESCDCCGGWYCDGKGLDNCCDASSLVVELNFSASPQLGDPAFGVEVLPAFRAEFPKNISRSVVLPITSGGGLSCKRYAVFSDSFNSLGFGDSGYGIEVDICVGSLAACCSVTVRTLYIGWKWRKDASALSAGDPSIEPAGYQYGNLVFSHPALGLVGPSPGITANYSFDEGPCSSPATLSVTGKAHRDFGSASGTITISGS